MRHLISILILVLLCGCRQETHVRNKIHSVLPQIEDDMREGAVAFPPEELNAWVRALDTSKVVKRLELALDEMPQYLRATLWMLKAYAPEMTWRRIESHYPDIASGLPDVAGYGEHPKIKANPESGVQSVRPETKRASSPADK